MMVKGSWGNGMGFSLEVDLTSYSGCEFVWSCILILKSNGLTFLLAFMSYHIELKYLCSIQSVINRQLG